MPNASGKSKSRDIKVSKGAVDEAFKALSNWGRWGKDDEIGTLNHITPADIIAAAKLIRRGQGVRARHAAGAQGPAARPVRQALEPDPHHARHRHRRARRPPGRPALLGRCAQHADPVGNALGFAGAHFLSRQDVQRAPRQRRRLGRPLQARHRARQGQAGGARRAARHRALQGRRHAERRRGHLQRRPQRLRGGREGRDPQGRFRHRAHRPDGELPRSAASGADTPAAMRPASSSRAATGCRTTRSPASARTPGAWRCAPTRPRT